MLTNIFIMVRGQHYHHHEANKKLKKVGDIFKKIWMEVVGKDLTN